MQKIIRGKSRGLAKLANNALVAAQAARLAKDAYDAVRSDATAAVKAEFPDLARGDVLVFDAGRIEGADAIERTLDGAAFERTIEKLYDTPVEAIAALLEQGVLKVDLAAARKVFGASIVGESRTSGSPKFVPAVLEEQKQAVNQ